MFKFMITKKRIEAVFVPKLFSLKNLESKDMIISAEDASAVFVYFSTLDELGTAL